MTVGLAQGIVLALVIYGAIGGIVAAALLFAAMRRRDPANAQPVGNLHPELFLLAAVKPPGPVAGGMTLGARILVFPGLALLWPLMLCRWWGGHLPPAE